MSDKPRVMMRPPTEADVAFICNSFLKSYRSAAAVAGVPDTYYYAEQHAIVTALLQRSHVVIACDPGEPALIFGWGMGEKVKDDLALHFFYCKHAVRNFGIAKLMEAELLKIPHDKVFYTFRTRPVFQSLQKRSYIFNPYLASK